jgi:hypothetical protein
VSTPDKVINSPYVVADEVAAIRAADLGPQDWQPVEDYIAGLERQWSPMAAGVDKILVNGNLRTFYVHLLTVSKPTHIEELLYEFVKIAPEVIEYMAQHPRGLAYKDELNAIFHQACHALIRRKAAGVKFDHLNGQRITEEVLEANHGEERCELSTKAKA